MPGTAKFIGRGLIPVEGEEKDTDDKALLKERALLMNEKFVQKVDELDQGSEYVSESSEEDPDAKWDAETILSTYTNTDNHPGIIKFVPKVKVNKKAKIELHTQFKVPVSANGLIPIAEEVEV